MEIEKKKKNWTTREFQKKKILRDACFFLHDLPHAHD